MRNGLKKIFEEHYTALCNYAHAIVKDEHLSKDIVQTVFIQLWENKRLLDLEEPAPYLTRCVRYKCLDYLKHPSRSKEVQLDTLPEIGQAEVRDLKDEDILPMLHYFADKLPVKMRQVFLMSRQQQMTYKEIADELNISTKTVENQMSSALKKLRTLLREHHYLPALMILTNIF